MCAKQSAHVDLHVINSLSGCTDIGKERLHVDQTGPSSLWRILQKSNHHHAIHDQRHCKLDLSALQLPSVKSSTAFCDLRTHWQLFEVAFEVDFALTQTRGPLAPTARSMLQCNEIRAVHSYKPGVVLQPLHRTISFMPGAFHSR